MTQIVGMHYCLPPTRLTNAELAQRFGAEQVQRVTDVIGIEERRVGSSGIEMSYYAAKHLLTQTSTAPADVGAIIFVSEAGDYRIPSNAAILQHLLGVSQNCMAFDIGIGCSGWPYAVAVAESLCFGRYAQQVLVLNSDTITEYLDPERRGLRCIHGDGAAATLVVSGWNPHGARIDRIRVGTDGSGAKELYLKNGYGTPYVQMNGAAIAHFGMHRIPGLVREALEKFECTIAEVDLVLVHQANQQIIDGLYEELGVPQEKRFGFLKTVGNLSNASTPVLLSEAWRQGKIKPGGLVLTVSFGAGLSWGCTLLQWPLGPLPAVSGSTELTELATLYGPVQCTL